MKDPELVKALDYILNHSNEASIEVLAQAIVRRRRDLTIFSATGSTPDPRRMASEITEQINKGVGGGIETMRKSIREMIVRIIRENAPELTDKQVDELCQAWLPDRSSASKKSQPKKPAPKQPSSKKILSKKPSSKQSPSKKPSSKKPLAKPMPPAQTEIDELPRDMLASMIEQFISFSRGTMRSGVDKNLRAEMGAWPEKYWNAFSPVIRSIITEFLKDKITEKEFNSKIGIALEL
ncbi:MAG: hypothetical protein LBI04_06145 [Treponema sp.]|jgi:hypothetical protein|nr:hypothetical protein [Treponema sp.]